MGQTIVRRSTSTFSRWPGCGGSPCYRAKMAGFDAVIQRGGIYTWQLIVTEPTNTALPRVAASQDFWKLAEAKAWFVRFAQEKAAAARAQPGAKGARRERRPRGGAMAPGAKT